MKGEYIMENYENNNVTPETEDVVETTVMEATPVVEENSYGQAFTNYQTAYVSKEEFLKNKEDFNKAIKTTAIVSYVLIAFNIITILVNFFAVIDVAILLGCTLGVHLSKKKGCAIAILIYGIFSVVVGLLSGSGPLGWMWIVIAIVYLNQFKKADEEYKAVYGA